MVGKHDRIPHLTDQVVICEYHRRAFPGICMPARFLGLPRLLRPLAQLCAMEVEQVCRIVTEAWRHVTLLG